MAFQLSNHFYEKGQVKHIILIQNINNTVLIFAIFFEGTFTSFNIYNYVCCIKTWVDIHIDLNIRCKFTLCHEGVL